MKKLTILTLLFFLALAGASAFAQEKKEKPMPHAMKGYLVDKMCATGMAKKSPEEAMAKAAKHTKSCALEESCMESGFGLISEGKWYKFDDAGDKQALAWLRKTDKKNELMVEVTGTHDGDIFNVISLKDVKAAGVKKEMKHDEMKKEDTKKD